MSQNAKRKTGSRRRLANESKPSESDEFRVTERTSVVQQENAEDVDAPGNSDFSPSDSQNPLSLNVSKNRRKLGSSRRNKGRQHAKDSAAESYPTVAGEHIGNTNNGEPVGTTEIPLTESEVVHQVKEEVCDDTLVGVSNVTSSGLHSSPTLDQPLKSQSCFTEMPEDLPSTFSVVEGEDDDEKLRQDGKLHDTQLGTESHLKSEDTLSDSFVEPEIVTVVQTDNESVDEAELESSKDKISSDKDYKEEEVLSQGRESLHSVVSEVHTEDEKPTEMPPFVMSSIGEAESFLQSLQSELDYPLYCQSQDNSMKIDEERHISLNPVENKINTGDSQRYEGLEEVGEDTEVTAKGTGAIEALETACLEEAIERTFEKESKPVCNDGFVMDSTQESLLYAAAKASYPEIENAYKTRNPEANLESLIPKNENLQGEHDEGKADFEVGDCDNSVEDVIEGADNGDSLQSQEVRGLNNSENVANNDKCEIKATQIDDVSVSSESVTCYATQNREKMSDSLMDPAEITYQTELSTDDSSTKQQGSNPNDKHATNKFCAIDIMTPPISGTERASGEMYKTDDLVEDDLKSSGELEKGVSSEMEDTYSSSRTLRSKIDACLDSQENDTNLNLIGNRRKLGSSRRNKGRQHAEDSAAESYRRVLEEQIGNTNNGEPVGTTEIPLTESEVVHQVKEEVCDDTLVGISDVTSSGLHSSPTLDQPLKSQSYFTEMPEELPSTFSVVEGEDDDEKLRQDGKLHDTQLGTESHLKSEDTLSDSFVEPEIVTVAQTDNESVDEAELESSKDKISSDKDYKEEEVLSQVSESLHSVVSELHKEEEEPTQTQEICQIDYEKSESSLQSLQPETIYPLPYQDRDSSMGTVEEPPTVFGSIGSRRKLGSSRRNKGQQRVKAAETYHQPKEELMDKTKDEEELDSTKRLLMMMTMQKESIQETEVDQEINPTVTVDRDSKTMPEENADLSQNVANNQIVTTDISLCSGEEDSLTSTINSEDLSQLVRYGSVSLGPVKSPEDDLGLRNISHDNNVAATLVTLEDLQQDAANQIQREVLSHDKGSFGHDDNVQQTNGEIENVRETRVERSIDAHVSGQQETLENPEDPTNKAPETTSSPEVANAELRSAAHNKSIPSASLCMQEILRAELVLDERTAVRTCDGQQVREEEAHLDEDFQGKSKQKRRKMGSTRWSHLYKKPEEDMDNKAEIKENVNMQVGEKMVVSAEVPRNENTEASVKTVYEQGETKETSVCQDKGTKQQSSTSKLQSRESNITSHTDSSLLTTLLPAQSASAREDDVTFVQVADLQDGDGNMDVSVELSQLGDFVVPEAHITSCSVNPVPHSNTNETINPFITGGSFEPSCEATENDEERLECGNVTQQQALNSPEEAIVAADLKMVSSEVGVGTREEHKDPRSTILDPNNTIEGVPQKSLETENSSCALNMANRRRKMGSTRRNLRSPREQEDLHQQQDVDNKTAEADVNIRTGSLKDSDSEQAEGKASEALDSSESQSKPVFHHEEHPVSLGQIAETDHQLSPSHFPAVPATPPEHDVVSETAAGGRRRKLGSHRKSHGPQSYDSSRGERETQNGGSTVEESPIRTTLDKISEVDGSDQRVSADTSLSSAGEHMKPMSERSLAQGTPVQHLPTEIHFSQERPVALSLGHGSGAEGLKSDSYNVILVGDSCVGKTSFMRRAQTGGFPLDVPMSVGLDTCMCTVVVDGKCVVLQFWDTVGQERYHSITRQIFHKAQAFLLMYDITSSRSFSAVSYWANCIQEGASENVIILLLGNKIDCAKRQVTTQDGEILAKEYNFKFMECSAVTGENVTQSLETVARMLSEKSEVRRETTQLHKEPPQKKSSGCC